MAWVKRCPTDLVVPSLSPVRGEIFSTVNEVPLEGAPVAQWVKGWPTDLADRVRSPLEAKSSQP